MTDDNSIQNKDSFSISVNQALVGVFALGLLVGFGAGAIAPLSFSDSGQNTNQDNTNSQKNTLEDIELENEPSLGSADANVKVIEYSDYGCPWCAEWAGVDVTPRSNVDQQQVLEQIKSDYIDDGKVQFIMKDYPAHPNAPGAHNAANCAYEQDKYWDYHDALFERRDEWMKSGQNNPTETYNSIASNVGLDTEQFSQCLSNADGSEPQEDVQNIRQSYRVGTPTFFIGNKEDGFTKVTGAQPYSRIKQVIDQKLS